VSYSTGVMLPRDIPATDFLAYAHKAEQAGFDELWVVEDCFFRGGIAQAAAVLASTTRIQVGIGILPAAVRNPVFTTLEVATLAELFPGRLIVGVGHGMPAWMRQVGAWPASPLTLIGEHLQVIRGLLRGETVTMTGSYVRIEDVALEHAPDIVPPVLAGVRGPRSLEMSGRHADGTILAEPVTPEYLAFVGGLVRDQDGPDGNQSSHSIVAYNVAAVDDDADVARGHARQALQWVGEPDWTAHIEVLDFAQEFSELRQRSRSPLEFAAQLPAEWVDQLAVVGTPTTAKARLDELHRAGAEHLILIPAGPDPLAALDSLAPLL
jgi:5,10-methylenetetrahydromethanopterin reductase